MALNLRSTILIAKSCVGKDSVVSLSVWPIKSIDIRKGASIAPALNPASNAATFNDSKNNPILYGSVTVNDICVASEVLVPLFGTTNASIFKSSIKYSTFIPNCSSAYVCIFRLPVGVPPELAIIILLEDIWLPELKLSIVIADNFNL